MGAAKADGFRDFIHVQAVLAEKLLGPGDAFFRQPFARGGCGRLCKTAQEGSEAHRAFGSHFLDRPAQLQAGPQPVARLLPTTAATTLRKVKGESLVIDGPFAETKEQFLGFYTVDVENLDEALQFARELSEVNPSGGSYEIRPVSIFSPATVKS